MNLPPLSLQHLHCLTDATGIIQHARLSIPDRHSGYTGDDNSRALVLAVHLQALRPRARADQLLRTYLAFLRSVQRPDGWFMNLAGDDPANPDDLSEDCFGRCVWACAEVVQCEAVPPAMRDTGRAMLQAALPHAWRLQSIRGCANALLGAALLPDAGDVTAYLADRLVAAYGRSADREWRWFEPILTYDLGRMPQALFRAARRLRDARYHEVAEATLAFLLQVQTADGVFAPIGSKGWYARGGERAIWDQQSLEAGALAEACIDAYAVTHHAGYIDLARWAFDWYLGGNMLRIPLHDPATGRCFDALTPGRPNLNCGAESLLSYLLAYTALRGVEGLAIWRRGAPLFARTGSGVRIPSPPPDQSPRGFQPFSSTIIEMNFIDVRLRRC